MSPRALRRLALLDIVGIPLLLAWYIWRLQAAAPRTWMLFLVWLVASFLLHRDTPRTLGWRADNLWPATRQAAAIFSLFVVLLLAVGLALGAPRRPPPHFLSIRQLWNYFAFCLLQQVALQSLLNNRLLAVVSKGWASSLLAGTIFSLLHWPNPVLVPVTFIGGTATAWMFARERNILPLAAGQAILGSVVWWAFPLAWHHSLRVGPGYHHFL
ncbi:MAG: hypothetical protein HY237_10345 [Acidobacteria bacterium]|nr:hypothetical protein [Acidobacteriota bacterium]